MGVAAARTKLERKLNAVFSARQIGISANRVKKLGPRADFLDISEALDCLKHIPFDTLRGYRRQLTIPPLIQRILTAAYREALFHDPKPIPLSIEIRPARGHSVQVTTTEQLITIVLRRPDPKAAVRR